MTEKYIKEFTLVTVVLVLSFANSVFCNYYSQSSDNYYPIQKNGYVYGNRYQQQLNYWPQRIVRRSQPRSLDSETTIPQNKPRRTHYGQTVYTESTSDPSSRWIGRWFPSNPSASNYGTHNLQKDRHNRVQMGVANSMCDDAKTNLTLDWDLSPINNTCYHPNDRFPQDPSLESLLQCDRLPPHYIPGHVCMNRKILYYENIPTHGDHRPLWPMFGEYVFVPRERWLHNIEHGAIVMLYHPCAHPSEVNKLKRLVKNCVGKHIITPSNLVPPERPLALVAWGCRFLMASVDEAAVKNFIRTRALRGPEGTYTKEGQYTYGLLELAKRTGNGARFGYSRVECVD